MLRFTKKISHGLPLNFRFGAYITVLFLLTKLLYLANIVAQLLLLHRVLGVDYSLYGIEVFKKIATSLSITI